MDENALIEAVIRAAQRAHGYCIRRKCMVHAGTRTLEMWLTEGELAKLRDTMPKGAKVMVER